MWRLKIAPPVKATRASAAKQKPAARAGKRFADEILAVLQKSKGLRLRAGKGDHRFIGIWFVVVKDRVLVRSWSVKANGWYRTFLREPCGTIQIGDFEIAVRVVRIRSEVSRTLLIELT